MHLPRFFSTASLILFLFVATAPFFVFASEDNLIISEIFFNPIGDERGYEWVEVFNAGSGRVNLGEWSFCESKCIIIDPNGSFLEPGEYLIIADNPSRLDFSGKVFDGSFFLSNEGEELKLKSSDGDYFDVTNYSGKNNPEGFSLELKKSGEWKKSCEKGGSPGRENCEEVLPPEDPICDAKTVRLNELLPDPETSQDDEFIELYNFGEEKVCLGGWFLRDLSSSKKPIPHEVELLPGEYRVFLKSDFVFAMNNAVSVNSPETVTLFSPDDSAVDTFSYTSNKKGFSWSYDETSKSWKQTSQLTPGAENIFDKEPEPWTGSATVRLNEILANPEGVDTDKEFIELYNFGSEAIDLKDFSLRDASKTGKFTFENSTIIEAGRFFVVGSELPFAINNSNETITLYDPNGSKVDEYIFATSKENISWSWDDLSGSWRMTKYLTPGEGNRFDALPKASGVSVPSQAYEDVYAEFSVATKSKVRWDFGDGRRSYKAETRHKYEKKGDYTVTLRITGESEDITKTFTVEVKKYPKHDVRIVEFSPNPVGKDSENEFIILENRSKKTVNLKGWSIATSAKSKKKLINHPIYDDVVLQKSERKIITREMSKFSLANTKGFIELRYPNGKDADFVQYEELEGIEEGEWYILNDTDHWKKYVSQELQDERDKETLKEDVTKFLDEVDVENVGAFSSYIYLQDSQQNAVKQLNLPPKQSKVNMQLYQKGHVVDGEYIFTKTKVDRERFLEKNVVRMDKSVQRFLTNISVI